MKNNDSNRPYVALPNIQLSAFSKVGRGIPEKHVRAKVEELIFMPHNKRVRLSQYSFSLSAATFS